LDAHQHPQLVDIADDHRPSVDYFAQGTNWQELWPQDNGDRQDERLRGYGYSIHGTREPGAPASKARGTWAVTIDYATFAQPCDAEPGGRGANVLAVLAPLNRRLDRDTTALRRGGAFDEDSN